jgi:hypothetical protein
MRIMRIMRQIGLTAENICFVKSFHYKTNFAGYFSAKMPHKSSFASCFGKHLDELTRKVAKT